MRVRERSGRLRGLFFGRQRTLENAMHSMTSAMTPFHLPTPNPPAPRRTLGSLAVAVLYIALVLGAPLLVRYGPRPEVTTAVSRVAVQHEVSPRCAVAADSGRPCLP